MSHKRRAQYYSDPEDGYSEPEDPLILNWLDAPPPAPPDPLFDFPFSPNKSPRRSTTSSNGSSTSSSHEVERFVVPAADLIVREKEGYSIEITAEPTQKLYGRRWGSAHSRTAVLELEFLPTSPSGRRRRPAPVRVSDSFAPFRVLIGAPPGETGELLYLRCDMLINGNLHRQRFHKKNKPYLRQESTVAVVVDLVKSDVLPKRQNPLHGTLVFSLCKHGHDECIAQCHAESALTLHNRKNRPTSAAARKRAKADPGPLPTNGNEETPATGVASRPRKGTKRKARDEKHAPPKKAQRKN